MHFSPFYFVYYFIIFVVLILGIDYTFRIYDFFVAFSVLACAMESSAWALHRYELLVASPCLVYT